MEPTGSTPIICIHKTPATKLSIEHQIIVKPLQIQQHSLRTLFLPRKEMGGDGKEKWERREWKEE